MSSRQHAVEDSLDGAKERRRLRRERLDQKRRQFEQQQLQRFSIRNFRLVSGLPESSRVYRSGHTDGLGAKLRCCASSNTSSVNWSEAEIFVARDAGLVIDLRSAPERREDDAQLWMKKVSSGNNTQGVLGFEATAKPRRCPIRIVELPVNETSQPITANNIFDNNNVQTHRYVIRLDVLSRSELVGYARNKWLHSQEATMNEVMTELNKRGLAGLNEAILETRSGKSGMCLALKLMTLYREALMKTRGPATNNQQAINDDVANENQYYQLPLNGSIVFHCVQGKDRTGMLAMLMQLLMGCSDTIIVDDYYRSNAAFVTTTSPSSSSSEDSSSAAAAMLTKQNNTTTQKVRMDASVFRGTNRTAMISTLEGLRLRHGQSLEGYFDCIGFDSSWRKRFVNVFGSFPTSRL